MRKKGLDLIKHKKIDIKLNNEGNVYVRFILKKTGKKLFYVSDGVYKNNERVIKLNKKCKIEVPEHSNSLFLAYMMTKKSLEIYDTIPEFFKNFLKT